MEGQPLDVSYTEQPASTVGTEKKSSTGLIIGIVAGVVALLVLCGCMITALLLVYAIHISQ